MDRSLNHTIRKIQERGPGKSPALLTFIVCLVEAFILTQTVTALDFQTFKAYTPALTSGGDSNTGSGRDSQFDAKRAVERFQMRSRQDKETRKESEEKEQTDKQAQEVGQNTVQEQRISQETGRQQQQDADAIYSRTTGLDSYSIDKDGGVWRQHVALLVEAWNVLSRDLYGNGSRSHMTDFTHNTLYNVTGMYRNTVDQAGRVTETVISGITYKKGETLRNYLEENKEATRREVTTTYHPTGNQVTQTELYDLVYQDGREGKVIAQKAKMTPLTGPDNPVIQETFDMEYEGDNVTRAKSHLTDAVTGVVTESETKSQFDGSRMVSSVSTSSTFDPYTRTLTQQKATQSVRYGESGVQKVDAKGMTTLYSTDNAGTITNDFKTVTESTQVMDSFFGIPNVVEVTSKSVTHDAVEVQTTQTEQRQKFLRDAHGNLIQASGAERGTLSNFDGSVVQKTESALDFLIRADQPYLSGRTDRTHTTDLIHKQDSITTSKLSIRLGALGEVLDGLREADTVSSNGDKSLVSTSHVKELFDRAAKVNTLGMIKRETSTHTKNDVDFSEQEENRVYLQNHDAFNRVTHAEETIQGSGKLDIGGAEGWTKTEGSVRYAMSQRTLQPYAVETILTNSSFDAFNQILTQSTQIQTVNADPNTGRALSGEGRIVSTSHLTDKDGNIIRVRHDDTHPRLPIPPGHKADVAEEKGIMKQALTEEEGMIPVVTVTSVSHEAYVGLEHANGLGLSSRQTFTDNLNSVSHELTKTQETLTQKMDGVGKILSARSTAKSDTDDEWNHGTKHIESFVQTDYVLSDGNAILPSAVKVVEVTKDLNDGSYRVTVREDKTQYDPYGRILPVNDKHPNESGFQRTWYKDVTVRPIPRNAEEASAIFAQYFGKGATPPPAQPLPANFRVPPANPWIPMTIKAFEARYGWMFRGPR